MVEDGAMLLSCGMNVSSLNFTLVAENVFLSILNKACYDFGIMNYVKKEEKWYSEVYQINYFGGECEGRNS